MTKQRQVFARGINVRARAGMAVLTAACLAFMAGCSEEEPAAEPATGVLTRQRDAAAEICPFGGTAIDSGIDEDADGTLDDSEVQATSHVCAGAEEEAAAVLTRFDEADPSERCPEGGTLVSSGTDDSGDGVLDDSEVRSTELICAGLVLTRLDPELPGEHCIAGGIQFHSGIDENRDGILGDDEIARTEYECGDTLAGPVYARSALDIQLLAGIVTITGELVIDVSGVSEVELPSLVEVGSLILEQSGADLVRMDKLQRISGGLVIRQNPSLHTLELPALSRITGNLFVWSNPVLSALPAAGVDGEISVGNNPALTALSFPISISPGPIEIKSNAALETISITAFDASIDGDVTILDNPALVDVEVDAYSYNGGISGEGAIVGSVQVARNAALAELHVRTVEIFGTVTIAENPALQEMRFSYTRSIHGDLRIVDNAAPDELRLTDLEHIGGNLVIDGSPISSLDTIGSTWGSTLVTIEGTLHLRNTALVWLNTYRFRASLLLIESNPVLLAVSVPRYGTYVSIAPPSVVVRDNAVLNQLSLSPGLILDRLSISKNKALAGLYIVDITVLADVYIRENEALRYLTLGAEIENRTNSSVSLLIGDNPALEELSLDLGSSMEGGIYIHDNSALTTISSWSALPSLNGDLDLFNNDSLTSIEAFGALSSARRIRVLANNSLSTLSLPALTQSHEVEIADNPALASVSMPVLERVLERLVLRSNASLASISLPVLESVNDSVEFRSNASLVSISMPMLAACSPLRIRDNAVLDSVSLPALVDVYTVILTDNPSWSQCDIDALLLQASPTNQTISGNEPCSTP